MKKAKLLHSELSYEIAKIGHTQTLTIGDAGLPIGAGVKAIDLALTIGVPTFLQTLDVVLSEMQVEKVVLAEEIKTVSPDIFQVICEKFTPEQMTFVPHETFKQYTLSSRAAVRTGECRGYANIILQSGVTFA